MFFNTTNDNTKEMKVCVQCGGAFASIARPVSITQLGKCAGKITAKS